MQWIETHLTLNDLNIVVPLFVLWRTTCDDAIAVHAVCMN
jgi:hypothetical protein